MMMWLRSWRLLTSRVTWSYHVFKGPHGWEKVPVFNAVMIEAIDHGCNWNYGDVLYSELENVVHREASSAVAI